MSEFKGTKGEWVFEINNKPKRARIEVNVYPYSTRPDFKINLHSYMLDDEQCTAKNCGCTLEETANAKLISFAPEMLEMLQELESLKSSSFILDELQSRAKELIKKATEL